MRKLLLGLGLAGLAWIAAGQGTFADEPGVPVEAAEVLTLWPNTPPGPAREVGDERDFTKPEDNLIAGRRIIKLGNVKTPQAHVFFPPEDQRNGSAVIVCPGGGFSILAWDLEGTEVAEWLNELGITAIVLKYRVPTRQQDPAWLAPVQDAQRCLSLVRSNADRWKLNPDRIGILGFSAGGETAARAAIATERLYEAVDEADQTSCRANAAILIYPGFLINESKTALRENVVITKDAPPMFMAHAADDGVPAESSVHMWLALKKAGVPAELHIYDAGGHGYGLRQVANLPVTSWHHRCGDWLKRNGWQ